MSILDELTAALKDMGYEMADIFEEEADPGLGNGGLGRLAACYMDGMATIGVRGTGYSIRYEHGIFKQKIENGQQVELPDSWLASGDVWQIPAMEVSVQARWQHAFPTSSAGLCTPLYVQARPKARCISSNRILPLRIWSTAPPKKWPTET